MILTDGVHLVSDESFEELHAFARRIGLNRAWFQGDHYDIWGSITSRALLSGAVAVSAREIVKRRVRHEA